MPLFVACLKDTLMLGGCGCTRFLRSTGLDCYSARNLMLLVVAVAYSRRAPVFLHSGPGAARSEDRARNSMHTTAKCSRARSYSTGGRDWEMATSDHDLMDRGWISPLYGVSVSPEVGGPDLESTLNDDDKARQGQQGHPMKSEEGQESRPGGVSRLTRPMTVPATWLLRSEEKEAEGSWFTHTDGRAKKERKRKENKNIKRKRGKKRIKNKSKEKERKKEPEKMQPLNTVEASAG